MNTQNGPIESNHLDDRTALITEKVNELMVLCKSHGLPFIAHVAAAGGKSIAAFWVNPENIVNDLVALVKLTEGTWESLLPDMTCKVEFAPKEATNG